MMQESILYERWQNLALSGETVRCGQHTLKVLQAGHLNTARGPDFSSARFRFDDVVFQGDVECHVQRKDWYRHQHHLDRAFANVLLHIVDTTNTTIEPVLHQHNHQPIPTIQLPVPPKITTRQPCLIIPAQLPLITELGRKRFHTKALHFRNQLQTLSPQQLFYEYFFRALGYSANSNTFQLLAQRLPWSWLSLRLPQSGNTTELLAVYSGIAGFLDSTPTDAYVNQLIKHSKAHNSFLDTAPLDIQLWQFSGIRLSNHPHFRLASWVHLLAWLPRPPFDFFYQCLGQRLGFEQTLAQIFETFLFPISSYWQNHYGFGLVRKGSKANYFYGKNRILEILSNLLLPLFSALAESSGSSGFHSYLEEFYLWLPALSGYEVLNRTFNIPDIPQKKPATLAQHQGLLYLKQHYCDLHRCNICPAKLKN